MIIKTNIRNYSLPLILVAIWVVFALLSPQYLGARNLSQLMIEYSITAILALGMLLVIVGGHIDLSAGSGVGLIGGVASVLVTQQHLPAPVALLIGLIIGVLIWSAMGAFIIYERIPSFIITLGGLLIFKGVFWQVIQNSTIPVVEGGQSNLYSLLTTYYLPSAWGLTLATVIVIGVAVITWRSKNKRKKIGFPVDDFEMTFLKLFVAAQVIFLGVIVCNQFRGVPLSFIILLVVAAGVYVMTQHTRFGRYLYAIGGNEEAAFISGVPIKKVIIGAFAIMGLLTALTGFMKTAYQGASTTTVGNLMELDAIAACVIGGTSLKGGRGTVLGVLVGALIMASLLNGMTLLAVAPENKLIARGLVLFLAVWMDVRLSKT